MARLSTTTTTFLAAAFFVLAAAGAGATEDRVPHHNGANPADFYIFSQGLKVAGRTSVSVPRHRDGDNTAMYIFAQGRKVAGGTSVSVPNHRDGDNTAMYIFAQGRKVAAGTSVSVPQHDNPAEYILARKLTGAVSATQACDGLEGNRKTCYTMTKLPGVTTPRTLLEAALRVALGRARALKATFDAAKLGSKAGNPMASILGSCDKNYDDLVSALEEASRALQKGGSSGSLITKMSAASTYASDCDNWFSERSLTSPYENVQRHAAQAVSVALGVAATNKNL